MSVIEQLRTNLKERIDSADSHALYIVEATLNAEDDLEAAEEIPEREQAEVLRRVEEWKANPAIGIPLDEAMKYLVNAEAENVKI